MHEERTIKALRDAFRGKLYVYLEDKNTVSRFLRDAEKEGYRFGDTKPTETDGDRIIAVQGRRQLAYLGYIGHMAFGTGQAVRIDYKKYMRGDADFNYVPDGGPASVNTLKGKFHTGVSVFGDRWSEAAEYIAAHIDECTDADGERDLYDSAEKMYDVVITSDRDGEY